MKRFAVFVTYLTIVGNLMLSVCGGTSTISPTTTFDDNVSEISTATLISNTNTTEFPTTCGINSSCTSVLETSTSKSILKNVTKKPEIKKPRKSLNVNNYRDKHFCTCNLKNIFCDVNCCCDKECSDSDKKMFTNCAEETNLFYDTRYCDYMKFIYMNNSQYAWEVHQNGLFCIVKSNLPPSYTIQKKNALKSVNEADLEKKEMVPWFTTGNMEENFEQTNEFLYGEPIWLIDHNNAVHKLQFHNSFLTNHCDITEDVLLLKDVKYECSQTDISEDNEALNLRSYFFNKTIIGVPHLFNISAYKNNPFQNCPKNICLPIELKLCEHNFKNCFKPTNFTNSLKAQCHFILRNNMNVCFNVVHSIKYNFFHNGTHGFKKIELLAILKNISYTFGMENIGFLQEFYANFLWLNETKNFSLIRSGNPGYIVGKPILIANLVNIGNSSKVKLEIQRNSSDFQSNFMVLPENVDDFCVISDENFMVIEFGYNFAMKCKFQTILKTLKLNATTICRNYQKVILDSVWFVNDSKRIVGMFGNANIDNLKNWVEIMYETNAEEIINKTFGIFTNKNKTLNCFNITTELSIDIFHSRVDFENLLNQEKILGVVYRFNGMRNISVNFVSTKNDTEFKVMIETKVMFYDITTDKKRKFVDAPTFKIRLPYDFFYPFIKIDNSGNNLINSNTSLFLVLIIYLVM